MLVNGLPNCTWWYKSHHTYQLYKQTWYHPLLNAHPLGQLGEGQPLLKPNNKKKNPNVKINILDEG